MKTTKKKIYVLMQVGFGAIAYNEEEAIIEAKYMEETNNDTYAGFSIKEVEIPETMFNLNTVDFWNYLTKAI